jgi:coenzyme PQQ synthesis protein D (PqqD)
VPRSLDSVSLARIISWLQTARFLVRARLEINVAAKVIRNPAVDVAPMKNECVLFQPQTNQFCLLNVTATFIWNQLERPYTVSELAQTLCDHYDGVSSTDAIRDVEQTVDNLLSLNCLTSTEMVSLTVTSTSVDEKLTRSPSTREITREKEARPKYEAPRTKILTEQEVLSSFQVTAAGTAMWWG